MTALKYNNMRHLLKRWRVRLKRWMTLGSIGIMPRLIIAFASVGALAATANLIVEKGVAILEQQRTVALERSAIDTRQIVELRESMGRARRAAMSAEVLSSVSEFDRATHEHADADSRASAQRQAHARAALDGALGTYLTETGAAPGPLLRLIAEHKKSGDALMQARRVRRKLLTQYSNVLTRMDTRVRTSIEQSLTILGRVVARQSLLDVRAHLDELRGTFASPGSFDVGELNTGPLAGAEKTLGTTLRNRESALRQSAGAAWYTTMTSDLQALTTMSVALLQNDARRINAADNLAIETRKIV